MKKDTKISRELDEREDPIEEEEENELQEVGGKRTKGARKGSKRVKIAFE